MKMDYKFEEDMGMESKAARGREKKHKLMTVEDVAMQLEKDFPEEIADCKKYLHMAGAMRMDSEAETHHYLMEMAKDEYTHAYFIYSFMEEHDITVPEECVEEFEELKEKMKEFF